MGADQSDHAVGFTTLTGEHRKRAYGGNARGSRVRAFPPETPKRDYTWLLVQSAERGKFARQGTAGFAVKGTARYAKRGHNMKMQVL